MAINLPSGFNITAEEPSDLRMVLTKDEMKSMNPAKMPSIYFCICKDDKQLYIYNKESATDPDTGKFHLHTAPSGADSYYRYEQSTFSDEWLITHNLNKRPSVTVIDYGNNELIGDVTYISDNVLKIHFSVAKCGYAYLN